MAIKDFMHALFKEEVEEDTEDLTAPEQGEPEPPTTVVTETEYEEIKASQPRRETPAQSYEEPDPVYTAAPAEYAAAAAPAAGKSQGSIFTGLDMDDIEKGPEKSRSGQGNRPAYKFDRSKLNKATVTEDYQAVISPIFGNIEDEDKEYEKVHNAVELPKPEEGFSMTTVISPMFGSRLPEHTPVEQIPDYRKKETRKPAPVKDLLDTGKPKGYDSDPLLPVSEEEPEAGNGEKK